jgi:hypothetical protein
MATDSVHRELFRWEQSRSIRPRVRYDQLMQPCWMAILPIVIALIAVVPSLLVASFRRSAGFVFLLPLYTRLPVIMTFITGALIYQFRFHSVRWIDKLAVA